MAGKCRKTPPRSGQPVGRIWLRAGALLIYGPKAAEVMEIDDSLTPEEAQEMEALGLLAQQKWEQGQKEAQEQTATASA